MRIKLKDIAEATGLSVSTVSRALNDTQSDKVRPETIEKINSAIRRLGSYNTLGEIEAKTSIGIVLASKTLSFAHPVFAEMFNKLATNIYDKQYTVRYVIAESNIGMDSLTEIICTTPVAGIVVVGPMKPEMFEMLKSNSSNLIYCSVNCSDYDVDQIVVNGYKACVSLVNHFVALGYKKIAYIGPLKNIAFEDNEHQRYMGYKDALKSYQLEPDPLFAHQARDTTEDGYAAMYKLINTKHLPDAIICTGDSIAIGVIRAAHEHNIKIPEDLAIAGMDNIKLASYTTPSLTTIDIQMTHLINLAIELLIDKIENQLTDPINLEIPFDLVIRESCGYKLKHI